jgi:16S rRNA (guanine(1405)-N(7))-methyltransferase
MVVAAVRQSKKYGDTSEETVRELAAEALRQHKKPKQALKAVRTRLHSIMAPYLGDPDYPAAAQQLAAAFASTDERQIEDVCREIMGHHLSTRERLPLLNTFYHDIFAITGRPRRLLDIACGLNPLAFPWMGLPVEDTTYIAYDIHEPRIAFLNHYFRLQGLPPLALLQDVALHFPQETADVALFLKEMPRFERNYPGKGRPFLQALRTRFVILSFPTISTHGGRNLTNRYRTFFSELIAGQPWEITELLYESELVFVAQRKDAEAYVS